MKKLISKLTILNLLLLFSISVLAIDKHHGIEPNSLRIESYDEGNGFTELEFNYFLDVLTETFTEEIQKRGGVLEIKRDWQDGAVNAFAWREGRYYMLEILGGLARHPLITKDAFALLVCHEMGHLLGGYPLNYGISFEGQADYYAPMKCMRKLYSKLKWSSKQFQVPNKVKEMCSSTPYCLRNLSASLSLTRLYAEVQKLPETNFLTSDLTIVDATRSSHPEAQCRLDTYMASSMCPVSKDINFSQNTHTDGACSSKFFPEYQRSKCWFKPN